MSDPLAIAAAALFAEASKGPLLWSTPDGHRCHGEDTAEGLELTVTGDGPTLVTRIRGVSLAALT